MGFFDSSTTTSSQTNPYAPAKGYMDAAIGNLGGQQFYQYGGPWYAEMNPYMSGANSAGYGFGQSMMPGAQDMMFSGQKGYTDYMSALANRGPRQFQYDQGLFNQTMENFLPGLQSQAALQGKLSSRALDSNLGQLMSSAGLAGGAMGSSLSSKLSQGSAMATAGAQEALQNSLQNLYLNAANTANSNAYGAGSQNLASARAYDNGMLSNYGNMYNMGMRGGLAGIGAMRDAGNSRFAYDQYKVGAGLDEYNNNLFGRQGFYNNQLGSLAKVAEMFGTNVNRTSNSLSGLGKIGQLAGLAGSIYGGPLGGMIGGLFGGGGMSGPTAGSMAAMGNYQSGALPMNDWMTGDF